MAGLEKDQFILRSISKISHKPWEIFAISRIISAFSKIDFDIEFSCQQLVRRPGGAKALTDLFLPQFSIHLEIDEGHHAVPLNFESDRLREKDIVEATGHEFFRVSNYLGTDATATKSITEFSSDIDNFVAEIFRRRDLMIANGVWAPWNFGQRYDPQTYIAKGFLDVKDGPAFRRQCDALRCFGYNKGDWQRAVWPRTGHVAGIDKSFVWFPRLHKNDQWDNSFDGEFITEVPIGRLDRDGLREDFTRIVFARYSDNLGKVLYRYIGEFALCHRDGNSFRYNLVRTRTNLPSHLFDNRGA